MDLGTLATTVFGIVTPIVTNKKVQKLSKTVWEKVKHWFIVDNKDTEELEDFKNNPNDKDFEDAFLSKLKSKLKKDENLRKELEQIINEAEKNGDEQTKIIIENSKNVMPGNISGVQGSVQIGDNINTEKQ